MDYYTLAALPSNTGKTGMRPVTCLFARTIHCIVFPIFHYSPITCLVRQGPCVFPLVVCGLLRVGWLVGEIFQIFKSHVWSTSRMLMLFRESCVLLKGRMWIGPGGTGGGGRVMVCARGQDVCWCTFGYGMRSQCCSRPFFLSLSLSLSLSLLFESCNMKRIGKVKW